MKSFDGYETAQEASEFHFPFFFVCFICVFVTFLIPSFALLLRSAAKPVMSIEQAGKKTVQRTR
jgi:hypothetical protein